MDLTKFLSFKRCLRNVSVEVSVYYKQIEVDCFYYSIDQVNNLREIQAMRRLNPHGNVVDLKDIIL